MGRAQFERDWNTVGSCKIIQKANFADSDVEVAKIGRILKRTATIDGVKVTHVTFGRGASVAEDAKGLFATEKCDLSHVGYVLSGTIGVRDLDGAEEFFSAGDIMMLAPGHDGWTVGDEDCSWVEFSRGADDYYGSK